MQAFPEYVLQLRNDVRLLRLDKDRLTRAHQSQKQKVERLEKQLKEQTQRIKELERENERLKREQEQADKTKNRYQVALFDHGNFRHPGTASTKKKGGQPGHADTNRERQPLDAPRETQRLFVSQCRSCGQALARVNATRRKRLVDIVLHPKVVNVLLERERQWCGDCHLEVCAQDERSLPFTEYGLNVFLLVLLLRFRAHASLQKIAHVLLMSHGLVVSKATLCNLLTQARGYLHGRYEQLIQAVRAGEVMYADETGWLVHGQQAWMWLIASDEVTVYFAAESRGKGIAQTLYGESQAKCMHDGYASYTNALPPDKHLYCWAHVLRFAHEETVLEAEGSPARAFVEQLVKVYQRKDETPSRADPVWQADVRHDLETLLACETGSRCIQAIQTRLRVQGEGLLRALFCTPDGTNNLAEREVRPMVISRRISNGSDTFGGMETSAVLGSIMQTASKQGDHALATVQDALYEGIRQRFPRVQHPACVAPDSLILF